VFEGRIVSEAKRLNRRVCVPEAQYDIRALEAAVRVSRDGWLRPVLTGDADKMRALAAEAGIRLNGLEICEPEKSADLSRFAGEYAELRREKEKPSIEESTELMRQPAFFAAMLVRHRMVDGMCSGIHFSTADVVRPCLRIVGLKPGSKTVFALCPIMVESCALGKDMAFFAADCGIVAQPTSDQLAEFAISSAEVVGGLMGESPRVAMLSFSTHGSASHPEVDKVRQAVEKVRQARPEVDIDGELQFDAALVEAVGRKKAPGSMVAGRANLLIFPNLDAANMTSKAMQCFTGGKVTATMILGLNGRINDHTRGATVEEFAMNLALTAVREP
jgi:phosphate acetyltransferase